MIKANALTRNYSDIVAVHEVSFEIAEKEIVALLGHNGAGKTTLLKMISGCLEPTSGNVELDGLDMSSNRKLMQQLIGFLPEDCPLYKEMLVLEYLDFIGDLRGVKPTEKAERISYAVAKTSLKEVTHNLVGTLSRGYRQRLGVAQALLNNPRLLVLDEPTNGLDPSQILDMRALIREIAQSSTVILSTHNLQEVQAISDRAIILDKGRVVMDAKLSELQKTSRLEIITNADMEGFQSVLAGLENLKISDSATLGTTYQYVVDSANDDESTETAAIVTSAMLEKGFKLYGIRPIVRDLETIFASIIGGNVETNEHAN